ncbi:MAG: hypothetical protein FWF59_09590 [Turicibacter sp.]|nr:hypothetical protein [Turicibacter sp.]
MYTKFKSTTMTALIISVIGLTGYTANAEEQNILLELPSQQYSVVSNEDSQVVAFIPTDEDFLDGSRQRDFHFFSGSVSAITSIHVREWNFSSNANTILASFQHRRSGTANKQFNVVLERHDGSRWVQQSSHRFTATGTLQTSQAGFRNVGSGRFRVRFVSAGIIGYLGTATISEGQIQPR